MVDLTAMNPSDDGPMHFGGATVDERRPTGKKQKQKAAGGCANM